MQLYQENITFPAGFSSSITHPASRGFYQRNTIDNTDLQFSYLSRLFVYFKLTSDLVEPNQLLELLQCQSLPALSQKWYFYVRENSLLPDIAKIVQKWSTAHIMVLRICLVFRNQPKIELSGIRDIFVVM